jgi:hypothetical protein
MTQLMAAVANARRAAAAVASPEENPRVYVERFEATIRPTLERLSGREIEFPRLGQGPAAERHYRSRALLLAEVNKQDVYDGDATARVPQVVSLAPPGKICSGIIIAKNAFVTALHCALGEPTYIRIGTEEKDGNGQKITIDPSNFKEFTPQGVGLDIAVLVQDLGNLGVDLPVFASDDLVVAATHLTLVGYGAIDENGNGVGHKRLGTIEKISADCNGPDEKGKYGCVPDYEMVGGARPLAEQVACPSSTDPATQQGACEGDSGGAAFVLDSDDKLYLTGVIRAHNNENQCGCARATNVYVRLDKQIEYLEALGVRFEAAQKAAL